jgi:hypothetical protein
VIGVFAAMYFAIATAGRLNLGIRHILPVYVPIFVLVAIGAAWLGRRLLSIQGWRLAPAIVLPIMLVWYGGSTLLAFPSYTSYFNELIGGGANAGDYFSDSSVDWGQDLLRLQSYLDNNPQIKTIALDYFGGGYPPYYFCSRIYDSQGIVVPNYSGYDCTNSRYIEWHSQNGRYTGQYIAVSETFLENDRYYAKINNRSGYDYLRQMKPIIRIGNSIYVFKLY